MLIAALLIAAPGPVRAEAGQPSGYRIAFDVVVLRPLQVIALAAGAALFVPAVVVSIPYGPQGREEAYSQLVGGPYARAFKRPLGDF